MCTSLYKHNPAASTLLMHFCRKRPLNNTNTKPRDHSFALEVYTYKSTKTLEAHDKMSSTPFLEHSAQHARCLREMLKQPQDNWVHQQSAFEDYILCMARDIDQNGEVDMMKDLMVSHPYIPLTVLVTDTTKQNFPDPLEEQDHAKVPTKSDTQEAEILRVVTRGLAVRDPSALAQKSHRGIGTQTDTEQAPNLSRDEALVEENDTLKQELEEEKEHVETRAMYDQALSDLRNLEQRYGKLSEKYQRQIAQRQSDFQKVQQVSEYCEAVDQECDNLEMKLETFEEKYGLCA